MATIQSMGGGYTRKTGGMFLVVGTVQHECTDCGDVKLFTAPPEFSVQEKTGEFYSDCAVHRSPPRPQCSLELLVSNTDLNTPPANWLLSHPKKIVGPAVSRNPKSTEFASFHMASSFLDSMGEVDVPVIDPLGDPVPEESHVYDDALPQFSKNIIWTFEDLRMLIGTDMPIFVTFVFRKIKDNVNVALLSCDLAKLHRLQARTLALTEKKEASLAE
ncbi:hypothetical protein DAPPUDRAFT_265116 [Daphnia pulex]|uniref:EDRF1 N-terminal domain-containing protein n=1 Tax=Daphnia pulex TaxID=6669 RepID=E9HSW6_DAPPU|nr:hypothetical protein DAPPUDRAFT_265116 [Daphnia pulex]|eukprot:EFX65167.1 hypothetical protein DAPPUDRAFT_265116 [Daphnia pulex]